jgi:hypothetical protein
VFDLLAAGSSCSTQLARYRFSVVFSLEFVSDLDKSCNTKLYREKQKNKDKNRTLGHKFCDSLFIYFDLIDPWEISTGFFFLKEGKSFALFIN